jgi:hypothetical protein
VSVWTRRGKILTCRGKRLSSLPVFTFRPGVQVSTGDLVMAMRLIYLCLLSTTLLFGAHSGCQDARPAPDKVDQKAIDEAIMKLRGEWAVESQTWDGDAPPGRSICIFEEAEYTRKWLMHPILAERFGETTIRFKYTIYNIEKQLVMKDSVKSDSDEGHDRHMIIRFRDEKLEMCFLLHPGKVGDTPTSFDGKKGSGQCLIILRKAPEKPK